jgi:hypothetical protein
MSSVIIVTDGSRHASRESLWFCEGHVLLRLLRGPRQSGSQSGSTHGLLDQFCVRSSTSR